MFRFHRVPAWLLAAMAAIGVAQWPAPQLSAQSHPSTTRAGIDAIQIRSNVYAIFGAGGNVTAHVGDDGVVLVDTGSAAKAGALLEVIRGITNKPIRLIINTGPDEDHVGGNAIVAAAGTELNPDSFNSEPHATVVAHENVMLRMSLPVDGGEAPYPVKAWPTESFTSRTRMLYVNDDVVQILRQTGAHSDGDSMVHFRRADVIATGAIVDLRQFPVIDPGLGGSIQGEIDALNRLLTDIVAPNMPLVLKEGRTLVVPGHGYVSDYAEIVEYRDMVTVIRDTIEAMAKKGMTLAQVKAANPTRGYRARFGSDSGSWTTDKFVEAVFNGVKGS